MTKKNIVIIAICTIISIISGIVSNDLIVGGSILLTGLLCAYFASEGKRVNYILGLINYLLMDMLHLKIIYLVYFSFISLFFHHFKLTDILLGTRT